jgi:transcriptional regulator with XRE-family HTH domain
MRLSEKVKLIRVSKGYTQKEFAELMKSGLTTITNYEGGHSEPNSKFMQKLCNKFPQYALWLMTDDVDVKKTENKTLKENSDGK